jgi:tetratricopeptide (TPR) repeat protein
MGATLAVLLVHTAPWVFSNHKPESVLQGIKAVVAEDVHYSTRYLQGYRLKSWAFIMASEFGDFAEAERSYRLRLKAEPDDLAAWLAHAVNSYLLGKDSEMQEALERLGDTPKLSEDGLVKLAKLRMKMGDPDAARNTLSYASQRYPRSQTVRLYSWVLSEIESGSRYFYKTYDEAIALDPTNVNVLIDYAAAAIMLDDYDLASRLLARASQVPNRSVAENADVVALNRRLNTGKASGPSPTGEK